MKCLLVYSFTFLTFLSFSQQVAIYDFENLSNGDITNQDGWHYSTSMSSMNNGYNCPVVGTPLIPQITDMPTDGDYIASKTIMSNSGWGNQHVVISRVNNNDWSFPSFQNKQFLILEFEMSGGCWGKDFRLAFDQNNDGNFGQNCGQSDPNEGSFGIQWFGCNQNANLKLFDANSEMVAVEMVLEPSWVKYVMVIDFYANNYQGSASVFRKNLTNQADWVTINTMQNINLNFDTASTGNNNPYNLNGIKIDQEAGVQAYFDNIKFTVMDFNHKDTTVCEGETITIGNPISGSQYLWNTGDTSSTIDVNTEGIYFVDLYKDGLKVLRDSITVNLIELPRTFNDTSYCEDENFLLFAGSNLDYHFWNDSISDNEININSAGEYTIHYSKDGCVRTDTFQVVEIVPPYMDLGQDFTACPDEEVILQANTNGTAFKWSDGSTQSSLEIKQSGEYHLTTSIEQCTASDTINVTFIPSINLGNDTTICEGDFFTIDLDKDYEDYSWHDGDKSTSKDIHYDGEYFVTVKKLNCVIQSDTLKVNRVLLPRILETTDDTLICENFPLLLKVKAELYDNLLWFDGHTDTATIVRESGVYWVSASNTCGVETDSIKVNAENCLCEEFLPNVFTPNEDRLNDFFGYQSNCIPSKYYSLQIFNRWGEQIFESRDYNEKWDGTYRGKICPTGVYSYLLVVQYKNDMGKRTIKRKFSLNQ
ncbi:MAG: gliding motility-associated C-terminal domain-containing protein [Flavobacteriales bacterium]|nr:gliding motility-associated C-terminal domain-containing protein [Flavobacteriales bacterium]